MRRLAQLSLLVAGLSAFAAAPDSLAQDKGGKKDAPPEKKDKEQDKEMPEKGDPAGKGQMPPYWKQLGLTDAQKAQVYKLNGKYAAEIDKLEAQIKELKAKRDEERNKILDAAQKKRLEEIIKKKAGVEK